MAAREGRGRGVAPERSPEARRKPGKGRQLLSLRDGRSAPLGACPRQREGTASTGPRGCGDPGRRSGSRGSRKGSAGTAVTAGRTQGVQEPATGGPAARHAKAGAKAPPGEARARPGSGLGPCCRQGSDVSGSGSGGPRVAIGTLVGGTRTGRADQGLTGRAKQASRRKTRVFGCHGAAGVSRRRGVGGVGCGRARLLRRSSRGVREPFVPPGHRPIARSPLTPLHFWGFFGDRRARWCRRPPREDRRHPIGTSEPDVPPGQHGAKARRLRFPDGICVTRPLPPANRILGNLPFSIISIA